MGILILQGLMPAAPHPCMDTRTMSGLSKDVINEGLNRGLKTSSDSSVFDVYLSTEPKMGCVIEMSLVFHVLGSYPPLFPAIPPM